MTRRTYSIFDEPTDGAYEKLLETGRLFCPRALLIVRPSVGLDLGGRSILEKLGALNGTEREASEWPGTRLLKGSVRLTTFDLNDQSLEVLTGARRLYAWRQPERPEDLCLLRGDGSTWLGSIAHERDAFLEIDEAEASLVLNIQGLALTQDATASH